MINLKYCCKWYNPNPIRKTLCNVKWPFFYGDVLVVFYYLSESEISNENRSGLWW